MTDEKIDYSIMQAPTMCSKVESLLECKDIQERVSEELSEGARMVAQKFEELEKGND